MGGLLNAYHYLVKAVSCNFVAKLFKYGKQGVRIHSYKSSHVVLTGVSFTEDTTGVTVNGTYLPHQRLSRNCHGTGDLFAAVFTALLIFGLILLIKKFGKVSS